ncbi:DUF4873 domain-containing protein [Kitasatospora indigofera]|uniref:DUF4873 domain-containing protein n=1 Tax=Kitasatospora indigofera TaxID=67307 RepID=UPI003664A5AE
MSGLYDGPATILIDGHAMQIQVTAQLRVRGTSARAGWAGILEAPATADLWAVHEADPPQLRLPNGNTRSFSLDSNADLSTGRLIITGMGSPPF